MPEGISVRSRQETNLIAALAEYSLGNLEAAREKLEAIQNATTPVSMDALVGAVPYESFAEAADGLDLVGLSEGLKATRVESRAHRYGSLSATEVKVLAALAKNQTMAETARELYISTNTLKSHCRSIYAKLRAPTRSEALTAAQILGLLD